MTTTKKHSILLTGGGTAGHVTPNIALIEKLKPLGFSVHYIGSKTGIESRLIPPTGVPYYNIPTGKLRRYMSWQNCIDPFKILSGIIKSIFLLVRIKPDLVFSKGGFVSFPVMVAAKLLRIPSIVHESDLTPGLANKLCFPLANKICLSFSDTGKYIRYKNKLTFTGAPLRDTLFSGSKEKGLKFCGFKNDKKMLLVYGGSLGAEHINQTIRRMLPKLTEHFSVAHICGKGKTDHASENIANYTQFEYLDDHFNDVMAAADIIISRSGANTVYELMALNKVHIFIPLSKKASRGEQLHNARFFEEKGLSQVIDESELDEKRLMDEINFATQHYASRQQAIAEYALPNGLNAVLDTIKSMLK